LPDTEGYKDIFKRLYAAGGIQIIGCDGEWLNCVSIIDDIGSFRSIWFFHPKENRYSSPHIVKTKESFFDWLKANHKEQFEMFLWNPELLQAKKSDD